MADPIKTTFTLVEGLGGKVLIPALDIVRLLRNEAQWHRQKGTPEGNTSARAIRRMADVIDTAAMDYSSRNVVPAGGDSEEGKSDAG